MGMGEVSFLGKIEEVEIGVSGMRLTWLVFFPRVGQLIVGEMGVLEVCSLKGEFFFS